MRGGQHVRERTFIKPDTHTHALRSCRFNHTIHNVYGGTSKLAHKECVCDRKIGEIWLYFLHLEKIT